MWDESTLQMLLQGVGETLYMTLVSTLLGYAFGLPLGVLLKVSDKEGLKPNKLLYKILDVIANIFRSIPFLILLILLIIRRLLQKRKQILLMKRLLKLTKLFRIRGMSGDYIFRL